MPHSAVCRPAHGPARVALRAFASLLLMILLVSAALAQPPAPRRPPIIGLAHIGLHTSDLAAARHFYGDILGFQQPFTVDKPTGGLMLTYFKINDHQYIEVFPDLASPDADRLSHIAFETTDIHALRGYLAANGVKVPAQLKPGLDGNVSMMIKDPEGHNIEFVQYMTGSLHSRNFGKFLGPHRISHHLLHVGFVVHDRAAEYHFFHDILGFQETWHGGMKDTRTDWVDMRVPDGTDWLEFMLTTGTPSVRQRGVMNHLALLTDHIHAAAQTVAARGFKASPPQIGRDGKWQQNLYDPDGTRVEMMGPKPVEKPCCSAFHNLTPGKK